MSTRAEGLACFQSEAGGLLELAIVRPVDVIEVLAAALAGDGRAVSLMQALMHTTRALCEAPPEQPKLCVACPRPLQHGRYSLCAAFPACDNPTQVIAFAVCTHCAVELGDIEEKAATALAKRCSGFRPVAVTHSVGGRA